MPHPHHQLFQKQLGGVDDLTGRAVIGLLYDAGYVIHPAGRLLRLPQHPALWQRPRTQRQAVSRILEYGRKYGFSGEGYESGGLRCPIGLFFTAEQIAHLHSIQFQSWRTLNRVAIEAVADIVGVDNVEVMTGLTLPQMAGIQNIHITFGTRVLLRDLERILVKGKGRYIGPSFLV